MGQGNQHKLKKNELKTLIETTHFKQEEIVKLYELYKNISSTKDEDGYIDKNDFSNILGLKDSMFVDRMFALFDTNKDSKINFQEFISGLSVFSEKGTMDEKLKFSFKIYDEDGDAFISREELYKLLASSLTENNLEIPKDQIDGIVDATFKEADTDKDGKISFDEYRVLVTKHPSMIGNMTITTNIKQ
eukprot:gene2875-4718_t